MKIRRASPLRDIATHGVCLFKIGDTPYSFSAHYGVLMPLITIHGIPPVDRPDEIHGLKQSVIVAAVAVKNIELSGKRLLATCPADRDTLETGDTVIVSVQGLFDRPSRSYAVRGELCQAILEVVRQWVAKHLPQCTYIEVLLDHPYDKRMGHAEWRKES